MLFRSVSHKISMVFFYNPTIFKSAYSVYQIDDRYCLYGKKYRFENGRIIKEDHRYFMANNQCKWLAATDTTKGDKQ